MGPTLLNYQNAGSSCNFLLCCEYFEQMVISYLGMIQRNFCKCHIFSSMKDFHPPDASCPESGKITIFKSLSTFFRLLFNFLGDYLGQLSVD